MKSRRGVLLASIILCPALLSGCLPLPDHSSGIAGVYPRVSEGNRTNEVILAVGTSSGWMIPLTPEGPHSLGYTHKTLYYFSNRHVRRKRLRFLGSEDISQWELFAPVQATNRWVRLQGYGPHTNGVRITVFTPHEMLYGSYVPTKDPPVTNSVHFSDGNRVINYKSERDEFTYDALDGTLNPVK